jgi:alpha,alpha-trehalase
MNRHAPEYRPIRDYAAIGDCHGHALVALDGSIDWSCLARHDAPPVFCRLLDAHNGGHFAVRPVEPFTSQRTYDPGTNILCTEFTTRSGRIRVVDLMPVGRKLDAGTHDYVSLAAPHWIIRRIEGLEGLVSVSVSYRPSRDFAREPTVLRHSSASLDAKGAPSLFSALDFAIDGDKAQATVPVAAGEHHDLVLAGTHVYGRSPRERVDEMIATTRAFWQEWLAYCRYRGRYSKSVHRSALALKMLTYAPSGAVVAALTASLPETIGGERNWDYRYSWLRDSAFTLYALAVLGYSGEARSYHAFLARAIQRTLPEVRIMYGVEGEFELDEVEHEHLSGYRGSRPVRSGNAAFCQRQIDVFGQVLDLALLYERLGGMLDVTYQRLLSTLADFVLHHWHQADHGIWEMRGEPRHHVHGRMISWVALDRALRLFGHRREWAEARDTIAAEVIAQGRDSEGGYLLQCYGSRQTDASVLLAPMLDFPMPDGTLDATLDRVRSELSAGDYLMRYRNGDGLEGREGAFLICSFWEVDAWLAAGKVLDAHAALDRLCGDANDVGLFAEQIDPLDRAFVGNFPQAFTHLALIGAAANVDLAERHGAQALAGTYADRAGRAVGATFGWRAILETMRSCWRCGRLRSSSASKLSWP